jgi:hypothetical protein
LIFCQIPENFWRKFLWWVEASELCFCNAFSSTLPVMVFLAISDLCLPFSFVFWYGPWWM